jgi:hypothetical protein
MDAVVLGVGVVSLLAAWITQAYFFAELRSKYGRVGRSAVSGLIGAAAMLGVWALYFVVGNLIRVFVS